MRIAEIRAIQPPTPGSPADWRTQLGQILIEIQTDNGLAGLGVGGGGAAAIHVIQTVLRDVLIGRPADQVEQIHRDLCEHTTFYGRKGLVVMAISGVDLALWDLRGQVAGQPVARLLNADVDSDKAIPTYATVSDEQSARQAIDAGHSAVKLHVQRLGDRPDAKGIAGLVGKVRRAIGDQARLMLDAFACWDVESTLRVSEAIAGYNIDWIEEPVPPDRLDDYESIVRQCRIPIAGGEHEYLAEGFKQLIDRRLHAVLQPDINWCGGMTTLVEIYRMARQANLRVCPHRGSEPYALHAIAALDNQPLAESPRPWFNCLRGGPKIQNGTIRLNSGRGFGVSVDDDS